jgi:enediyne biosynthesis protein E4
LRRWRTAVLRRAARPGLLAGALALSPWACKNTPADPPAPTDLFTDVTAPAGIRFVHDNGGFGNKLYPEIMGSGAAFLDANGDGYLDLFLVNGAPLPGHPKPDPQPGRLYLNRGDGTFQDRTVGSGLEACANGMGVAVGDVDNDGDADIYVTRQGQNALYLNRGGGTFQDVTAAAGIAVGGFSSSAAFVDCDGDGLLDLYVCRNVPWNSPKDDHVCLNPEGEKSYCSVHVYPGMEHRLFRNVGKARFKDVTREAGIAGHEGRGLAVVCGDYDRDGDPDIFVANDEMPNLLWRNDGRGRFSDVAAQVGFALNEYGKATAGMGLDIADADGDGFDDVIESDFQGQRKTLYVNDGRGFFSGNPGNKGPGDMTVDRLGFGIGFLDYDLDGWPDLFIANGHVNDDLMKAVPPIPYQQTAQLFHNEGQAVFTDASALLGSYGKTPYVGRGTAFGDYDNDGDTDLLIMNNAGPAVLLRNENAHENHWIGLRCIGSRSNRSGYGALITLHAGGRTRTMEIRSTRSYLSASDPRVVFGLGPAARIDRLTVRWPSGASQEITDPACDRYHTIAEGEAPSGSVGKDTP